MKNNDVYFGVDYYPEHWPRARWKEDAKLMKEAGFDAIRLAEFSWSMLEPELNRFDFGWLDDAIALFAGHGIKAVLGTPTAAPPAWVIEVDPEILPVNKNGTRLGFGGRHHVCHSNAKYREHATRVVNAMADHYRDNDAVIGWQIDNELGNSHDELCMCGNCLAGFREWLEKKYGTIEKLNESWGTAFWSQTYSGFCQVPGPRVTPNSHSPSLLLDWKRFCSDLVIGFGRLQIDIIREKCPGRFITHNFMGFFDKLDYHKLAGNLDFVSHDQYPGGFWLDSQAQTPPSALAASLDLMRGMKDEPFWIMEQQAGPTGWETMGQTPRPGQLRLWTAQSVARGADAVFYFRWRTCVYGTEQYWHGILPHNGIPGRGYDEIRKTVSDLRPVMKKTKGLKGKSGAAILFSYEQNWAIEIQPHHPDLDYIFQAQNYHSYFYRKNIPVDFIPEDSDFSGYSLIVAPLQFLTLGKMPERLKAYVSGGGNVILTMRTGVKDENNVCLEASFLPCGYNDLLGIEIRDYDCLRTGPVPVNSGGRIGAAVKWCDIIDLDGAKALATYGGGYYEGSPAVTANAFGKGRAYYIGFEPDDESMMRVMDLIAAKAGFAPTAAPSGLEIVSRPSGDGNYFFVLNHGAERREFTPNPGWEAVLGSGALEPYGIAIYLEKAAPA